MRLVEKMRAHPWLATASAGALVGVVIGLFLPIRAAAPPKAEAARWSLPTPSAVKRFDDARYQSVRNARFWGDIQASNARGKQASGWTLTGIVTRPTVRIAVIAAGKPAVSWLRPGEALPDGATFVVANRDTIWFEKGGCRHARGLYQKPSAVAETCIGSGQAAPVSATAPSAMPAARKSQ